LQSEFAAAILRRHGIDPQQLDTVYLVLDYGVAGERLLARNDAATAVLERLGGFWRLAAGCCACSPGGFATGATTWLPAIAIASSASTTPARCLSHETATNSSTCPDRLNKLLLDLQTTKEWGTPLSVPHSCRVPLNLAP